MRPVFPIFCLYYCLGYGSFLPQTISPAGRERRMVHRKTATRKRKRRRVIRSRPPHLLTCSSRSIGTAHLFTCSPAHLFRGKAAAPPGGRAEIRLVLGDCIHGLSCLDAKSLAAL